MALREIKFRAWDDKEKIYQYNFNIEVSTGKILYKDRYTNWILEQYTGFKDMNDCEIYEGDIVQRYEVKSDYYPEGVMPRESEHPETKRWRKKTVNVITMNPEVRFGNEFICGELKTSKGITYYDGFEPFDYLIIGNIHKS